MAKKRKKKQKKVTQLDLIKSVRRELPPPSKKHGPRRPKEKIYPAKYGVDD